MLVVTPNLCFDVTVRLPVLVPGTVMRAAATVTTAGGKGVNVARSSARRGVSGTRLIGFVPETNGDRLHQLLADDGIDARTIPVPGEVRIATIFSEDSGRASVVNGRGALIEPRCWQQLRELVADTLRPGEVLVCSGSLPPGVPDTGYAELLRIAKARTSPVVIDAAPAVLSSALPERPDLVCPNLSEAEGLLNGRTDETVDDDRPDVPDRAMAAAEALAAAGARIAVVTAGGSGVAWADAERVHWIPSPAVSVVSPIGAGDSFVGGAAPLLEQPVSPVEAVLSGMATASASCESALAGGLDPARARQLEQQLRAQVLGPAAEASAPVAPPATPAATPTADAGRELTQAGS